MSNNLSAISVSQLKQAIRIKQKIESLSSQLEKLLGPSGTSNSTPGIRKGGISPAGRAAIRAAQKARWAKVKGKGSARTGKRKFSAAARAKIAAAAKRRWQAAKAAGKSRL